MSPVIPSTAEFGRHGFERKDPMMDEKGLSKQVSGACEQFFPAPRIETPGKRVGNTAQGSIQVH
jgi:hypothetical protein